MRPATAAVLVVAVLLGVAAGVGGYTFVYAKGGSYLTERSARLRQLPRHARAVSRLGRSRATARSPSATTATRRPASSPKYADQGDERLLALVRLHHRRLPRADPHHAAQPRDHRARRAASATRRSSPRSTRPATPARCRASRCHRVGRPPGVSAMNDASLNRRPRRRWSHARVVVPRSPRSPPRRPPRCWSTSSSASRRRGTPSTASSSSTDETDDPAVWGKNFPLQYDGYRRTVDQVRTRYGGSEAVPRTPTAADPRSVVAQSRLEEDPRLKTMWAGYAFAVDFREERGHAYMLDDQTFTERQQVAPSSRAPACTATPRSTCRTRSSATAT